MVHHDELEFEGSMSLLSTPTGCDDPGAWSRRRFLQGALVAAAGSALPVLRPQRAAAEPPARAPVGDGILVVVFLGGGNDGLNTVAPIEGPPRTAYDRLRGGLAIAPHELLPLGTTGWGLHPALTALHARFRAGRVAVVQGVGLPVADLSHFTAAASVMRGTVDGAGVGWLGRYLDGIPDGPGGLRGLAVGSTVPPYLTGDRSHVTTVPSGGALWGAEPNDPIDAAVVEAVASLGGSPTGLGTWGDRVAASGGSAIATARSLGPALAGDPGPVGPVRDVTVAARLLNLDLGARVVGLILGGWDTHSNQAPTHDQLLRGLDAAIDSFFRTLSPRLGRSVTVLVQSEFGRRAQSNGGLGTDHGRAAPWFLIGDHVAGGVHGAPPDLARLDDRGNLVPTVDFRSVYADVLERGLGADARQLLGGRFEGTSLFASRSGGAVAVG